MVQDADTGHCTPVTESYIPPTEWQFGFMVTLLVTQ